ncbi:MAG TPA: DUF2125 domain-containing protein, partial [Rhizomicrobium sp.]|nr:DUF2125 domain-containing protein [Rhizomicrobium sp.]
SAAEVQLHLRDNPTIDGLDLYAFANNVHFAADEAPAFGPDMKHFAVNAMVSPGSSFAALLSGHGDWRAAANDWQARHGSVLVNAVEVNWGPLDATGKGALAVDDLHRPVGELRFAIDDWQGLTQKLSAKSGGAQTGEGLAQSLFSQLSTTQGNPSKPLNVTLAFKDGVAYAGMMPADLLSPLY